EPLAGRPALVLLGSAGWLPNADAVAWFVSQTWPEVRLMLPEAHLHLFGAAPSGVSGPAFTVHPPPADSRDAFPAGSIHLVPLRIGSGVRMKVLEAWARGGPVVSTTRGACGLAAVDGRELLLADEPAGFCRALVRLTTEPDLAARLVAGGRAALALLHDPATIARQLIAVYEGLAR
ncbi:MAG TPA: glycosyltransferase, partial [Thermoanaerobaculia bacterium]